MKKCPYCAEEIQADAVFCKHCRRDLSRSTAPPAAAPGGQLVNAIHKYQSHGYRLVSQTPQTVTMERQYPVNWLIVTTLLFLFWPGIFIYQYTRKKYTVQLSLNTAGQVEEYGGTLEVSEQDRLKGKKRAYVLIGWLVAGGAGIFVLGSIGMLLSGPTDPETSQGAHIMSGLVALAMFGGLFALGVWLIRRGRRVTPSLATASAVPAPAHPGPLQATPAPQVAAARTVTQPAVPPQPAQPVAPPTPAAELFAQGARHAQRQEWPQAIAAFQEAVRLKPDFAQAHQMLALSYGAVMDTQAALKHYEILKGLDEHLAQHLADTPAFMLILRGGTFIRM